MINMKLNNAITDGYFTNKNNGDISISYNFKKTFWSYTRIID